MQKVSPVFNEELIRTKIVAEIGFLHQKNWVTAVDENGAPTKKPTEISNNQ